MFLNILADIDNTSGIVVASLVVGVSYYLLSKKSIFSNFSKLGLIIHYLIIILLCILYPELIKIVLIFLIVDVILFIKEKNNNKSEVYRPQKVRPKNLTFWRSVFLCQNTHLN